MSDPHSTPPGLDPDLSRHIREALLQCAVPQSNPSAKALFIEGEFAAWQRNVPEANTEHERAALLIAFLRDQWTTSGQNTLVLSLRILADDQNTDNILALQLAVLATEMEGGNVSALLPHEPRARLAAMPTDRVPEVAGTLPLQLDRDNPNLGRYSAVRRVARTLYLGSAPTLKTNNPGLDERSIKLGCTQPGESVATFGDALRRLSDQATHLYQDRSRYWFSTQPSVTRLAQDRAAQVDQAEAWEELKTRLRAEYRDPKARGELAGVHVTPASSGEVPDEMEVRLVILAPEYPHSLRDATSPGYQQVRHLLAQRGSAPRLYQNMLVFLAPERNRLAELEQGIRQYLAWKSIKDEWQVLNLDAFQRNQAETKYEQAHETVAARIKETYTLLMAPHQSDPRNPETLELQEFRLQGNEPLAVRASRKLKNDELLITDFSAIRLRLELDKHSLWQGRDHLGIKQLWEYFARYPYLSRLKEFQVLASAVQEGVGQATWQDNFAYAQGYDEQTGRYLNLRAGQVGSVMLDGLSLLVTPAAAARQLAKPPVIKVVDPNPDPDPDPDSGTGPTPPVPPPPPPALRRFYGVVELDPMRVGRDAGEIAQEVIQHLTSIMGAKVKITLEIHAELPDGASEQTVRTVMENARTLKFKDAGFEER